MAAARRGATNSPEHRAKVSAGNRRRWREGGIAFKPRACRACGVQFTPNSNPQRYCSRACKNANRHAGKYGLSATGYLALVEAQMGACALCGAGGKGFVKGARVSLVVDHDHGTGRVRGLLRGDCNTALGRFGDNSKRLRAAARYLENPPMRRAQVA